LPYRLPARIEPVLQAMKNDRKTPRNLCNIDQARRVAWRQLLRWIEAQLALVGVGMVDVKEIFMPYLIVSGKTFYEISEQQQFMIEHKQRED
jgi:hypothetical protein